MYDYIKGMLVYKSPDTLVVENNGIGYKFLVNSRTSSVCEINKEIKLYTKLVHKEDIMYLAGFKQKEDRAIFDILTSVSGIGTKVGMVLLDEFSGSELINAVLEGDYKLISRAKGVGPKLAQKIILELKGKLTNQDIISNIMEDKISSSQDSAHLSKEVIKEVQAILQSLGYTQNEYTAAIEHSSKLLRADASSEELLKEALKSLSQG